eukprot:4697856-Pleurochrysis_carterae.AAC.5
MFFKGAGLGGTGSTRDSVGRGQVLPCVLSRFTCCTFTGSVFTGQSSVMLIVPLNGCCVKDVHLDAVCNKSSLCNVAALKARRKPKAVACRDCRGTARRHEVAPRAPDSRMNSVKTFEQQAGTVGLKIVS